MNVPKLRFKEFNDEWNIKKIKDIALVVGGGTPSTDISEYWNGNIQWFTPSEVGKNKYVFESKRKITQQGLINSSAKLLPTGTILLSSRATVGEASILLHEASTNQGFQSLIISKENNNEFIYYLTTKIKKEILTKSFGSTFLEISKSNLEKITIKIPIIDEQNKISQTLKLLDKKIELQSKKIEALKLYKKGLIDGLVVKENCPLYKLSDIGFSYAGLSGKSKEDFDRGNSKFITYMSVFKNDINLTNLRNVDVKDYERQNIVETGDLFFTVSSETKEEVGMCATWNYNLHDVYLNSFCFGYRLNDKEKFNNQYLCYLLGSKKLRKTISNLGQGFTRVNISKSQIMDINVNIPNIGEQNKEVLIFNLLTLKVKNEIQKQEKLEQLKKGLMQSMFV